MKQYNQFNPLGKMQVRWSIDYDITWPIYHVLNKANYNTYFISKILTSMIMSELKESLDNEELKQSVKNGSGE